MSYKSAEKKYYEAVNLRDDRNLQKFLESEIDIDLVRKKYFSPGKRYHLVEQVIGGLKNRNSLLELGCGSGETIRYIQKKYQFSQAVGIDIAFKDNAIFGASGLRFYSQNLNDGFEVESESVDLLIGMMVFEHLFDPFESFSETARVLSPKGIAVINLPLVTSIKNRLRLLFGQIPQTSVSYRYWMKNREWDGNHLHYFNIESIRNICELNHLKIIKIDSVGKLRSLKNLFPSILCGEITFAVIKS